MNKLRFAGKPWSPFKGNPKATRRAAKLHRMIAAGTLQPMTKAGQRQACTDAIRQHNPQRSAKTSHA